MTKKLVIGPFEVVEIEVIEEWEPAAYVDVYILPPRRPSHIDLREKDETD